MAAQYENIIELSVREDIQRYYTIFVSGLTINTSIFETPEGIHTWIQGVNPFIVDGGRHIDVASRTVCRRNLKILICVFLIDEHCLIVLISNIRAGVTTVISEFILEYWNLYMGREIEDVMHLLTPGLEWSDRVGRPTMIDINVSVALVDHLLQGSNLYQLSTVLLHVAPMFPIDVATDWDRETLTLGQIGTLVVEGYTIELIGNALTVHLGDL